MQRIEGKPINIIIEEETRRRILAIAEKSNLNQSQTTRMLLRFGCDVYEDLSAVGIVQIVEALREAKQRITPDRRKLWDATR